MSRVVRAAAWFTAGFIGAVVMAFAGDKFRGLFIRTWSIPDLARRALRVVRRPFNAWLTWQGASPDKRRRMSGDDRHDVWPTNDMGRQK